MAAAYLATAVAAADPARAVVIEELLPAWVACAESTVDPPDVRLFPEEEAAVLRAVEKRRTEFSTVRHCARQALGRLGLPAVPIVPGLRGAPGWPAGIVGSMTHCAGYRAAAVAFGRDAATIGIDAEPHQALPAGVLSSVALPAEVERLDRYAERHPEVWWDRLLFSAKESVYKAWYPLTGKWLDFHEASVEIDPVARAFTARLLVPGPTLNGAEVTGFDGRYRVADGLIVTAIAVPAPPGTGTVRPGTFSSGTRS